MKKYIKKFLIFIILFCIILMLKNKFSYAKYLETKEVKTLTNVAKPIITFSGENVKNIECLNLNKYMYEFSVKNFDDNLNSEVGMKYNIIFELSQKNAPVIINLYRKNENGEEKIELKDYKTVNYEIMNLENKQNNYRMEI